MVKIGVHLRKLSQK